MPDLQNNVVLFDAVGTLIYADPPVAEVYCEAGKQHDLAISVEQMTERFAAAFRKPSNGSLTSNDAIELQRWKALVAEVFHETPAAHDALFDELWQHFADPRSWQLFDDVAEILAQLRQQKVQIGVASNFDRRLQSVCEGHDLLWELQLFWSSDVGYSKPHPRFFRELETRLAIAPERITLVGDDVDADFWGAKNAGWKAVLIDRERRHDYPSIASLDELPALLAPP